MITFLTDKAFLTTVLTQVLTVVALVHPGFNVGSYTSLVDTLALGVSSLVTAVFVHGHHQVQVAKAVAAPRTVATVSVPPAPHA